MIYKFCFSWFFHIYVSFQQGICSFFVAFPPLGVTGLGQNSFIIQTRGNTSIWQLFWYSPRCQGFDPWPKSSCRTMGFYLPKMELESSGKKDWISNHWIEPPTMETTEINRQTEDFFYQCWNRGRHPHKGYSTKENQNRHFQCPAGKPHENRDQICCPVLLHQLAVFDRRMLCAEVGCQDRLSRWPSARICNGLDSYTFKPMVFGLKATPFGWYSMWRNFYIFLHRP